jgi:hypothetical protein
LAFAVGHELVEVAGASVHFGGEIEPVRQRLAHLDSGDLDQLEARCRQDPLVDPLVDLSDPVQLGIERQVAAQLEASVDGVDH